MAISSITYRRSGSTLHVLFQHLALALSWLLLALAGLLFVRRLAGGMQQPLSTASLLSVALVSAGIVALARALWCVVDEGFRLRAGWLVWSLPALAGGLLGAAVSLPGTKAWGLSVFWGVMLLHETGWWLARLRPDLSPWNRSAAAGSGQPQETTCTAVEEPPAGRPPLPAEELAEELIVQQLTRMRLPEGGEAVGGLLRYQFPGGERSHSLHVGFCPPLHSVPRVEVEQLDGPASRVKVAEVQSYGLRFDVRLAAAHRRPRTVVLRFEACAEDSA